MAAHTIPAQQTGLSKTHGHLCGGQAVPNAGHAEDVGGPEWGARHIHEQYVLYPASSPAGMHQLSAESISARMPSLTKRDHVLANLHTRLPAPSIERHYSEVRTA